MSIRPRPIPFQDEKSKKQFEKKKVFVSAPSVPLDLNVTSRVTRGVEITPHRL